MKKVSNILLNIFSVGVLVCLFAGGISVLGYIVALCIGGTTAEVICAFVFTQYLPWVIKLTTIFAFAGLIAMYLTKKKALVVDVEEAD